jgi:adenylate kinase
VRVILVGPPGSGKGTQAKQVSDRFAIPHISTGDILREAVRNKTALGLQAEPIMASGGLVPDDLMIGIIRERLDQADAKKGFLLDGFPRTVVQAEKLDAILGGNEGGDLSVVMLLVPDALIINRITLRRSCGACGAVYHLENLPPKAEGVCDKCGAALVGRPDDNETAVVKRLAAYHAQTAPVAEYYRGKGQLKEVDGNAAVDVVFERVMRSLGA